ncbi:methyltransferase domain-containing protein [Magnetospirillum gryphiswaldense]|uniref:methyltransferase domain-containing protein n=1 Tax=Magnetospirillum gryphiswaldense TaxID=55518 RepID=UPI000D20ED33|nr:methyltransferase domain-containing protein [Magnetospirillum gryphiswaldense]AVM75602.1 hypothetical protein MSR1_31360 [Magnetospirillum gryphiswaldense MSR-1]AVM79505.1 hypothetical protein MSR1L_31360 [Magnetospirillum gryphiswaldense]
MSEPLAGLMGTIKTMLKAVEADPRALYQGLSAASLKAAATEQGLQPIIGRLRQILPDISDQYTAGFDPEEYRRYWEIKMRGLHAFQVQMMLDSIDAVGGNGLVLADIGDSSGNHGLYLRAMVTEGKVERVVSVNLDPVAVEKVRAKGGDSILCRAEELDLQGIRPDLFMTFEMVEHLTDPIRFLHRLAEAGSAEHLLMTVPHRRYSRFGGVDLRLGLDRMPLRMTAEEVHIYEFCPADWLLLARFAGWVPVFTRLYRQYPCRSPLVVTKPLWRRLDFDGFWGVLLRRDLSVARRYADW